MGIFQKAYRLVSQIPAGKVVTYGQVAKALGITDPRVVGWALHANKDFRVPCHRVVNGRGELAPGYAFGGKQKQKRKLLKEGVTFLEEKVDLVKYRFVFSSGD